MTLALSERPALEGVSDFYTVVNPEAVAGFLASHPAAVGLLRDAESAILEHFPAARLGRINVELFPEPDSDDPDELSVEIETDLNIPESLDALSTFRGQWFLTRPREERRDIVFEVRNVDLPSGTGGR